MSLADWTQIYGNKGGETTQWHTAGEKSYQAPTGKSAICHNKTLNDKPKSGYIDFDFRLPLATSAAGAVFKGSSSEFLYIKITASVSI